MERPVTPQEAAVVRWLLEHAPVGDVTLFRQRPLEELRVFDGCDRGCCSLDFQPDRQAWGRAGIIADAWAVYPDGRQADLILRGRDGEIVLLEVIDWDPRAPHRFPEMRQSFASGRANASPCGARPGSWGRNEPGESSPSRTRPTTGFGCETSWRRVPDGGRAFGTSETQSAPGAIYTIE